jgi:hypothetical protein
MKTTYKVDADIAGNGYYQHTVQNSFCPVSFV